MTSAVIVRRRVLAWGSPPGPAVDEPVQCDYIQLRGDLSMTGGGPCGESPPAPARLQYGDARDRVHALPTEVVGPALSGRQDPGWLRCPKHGSKAVFDGKVVPTHPWNDQELTL
jgi:hypothetical protein